VELIADPIRKLLKTAARLLTGAERREFQAKTTVELFKGSARLAETVMGWNRDTVELGLNELRTGLRCVDNFGARGRKKSEALIEGLEGDIRDLVDPTAQADPRMRTTLAYTRITASRVRQALIEEKGYTDEELPGVRAISNILNRLGYRLRRVEKTRPQKESRRPMPSLRM
jgi:hypothetical protein